MTIKKFRGVDFVNRDKEINFFLNYFQNEPERVMWVYGPKSAGKTTLLEYIIENYLLKQPTIYNVKYINFRGLLVSSFETFVESFLEEKDKETQTELKYNLFGVFQLEAKTLKKIKENKKNLFHYLIEEFQKEKRKNIFIIDEIQTLQDIYLNGEKLLLNEFLNFCVRLTKELHISHVLFLTSNTIFLSEIYNNAKLKETSRFKFIGHLGFEDVKEWLLGKGLGLSEQDVELIYDYVGGSATRIKIILEEYQDYNSLKECLEQMVEVAKNEIIFTKNRDLTNEDYKLFLEVASQIVRNGFYVFDETDELKRKNLYKLILKFCEIEIFFFDPIKNMVTVNSQIYVKAFTQILAWER